jgi:hypothetical protein
MALLETGDGGRVGRPVFERQGRKLGKLERVYDDGDRAIWGAVRPRFLGRSHIVPLGTDRCREDPPGRRHHGSRRIRARPPRPRFGPGHSGGRGAPAGVTP